MKPKQANCEALERVEGLGEGLTACWKWLCYELQKIFDNFYFLLDFAACLFYIYVTCLSN